MMNTGKVRAAITPRKLIGTLAVALVVALGAFGTAKAAQAFFLGAGPTLIFNGVVGSVQSRSFTAFTTSTSPIMVNVTRTTVFSPNGRLSDLAPGASVKVISQRVNGRIVAQVVQMQSNVSGYGTAGDTVLVSPAVVVSTSSNSFVARSNGVNITFHVNGATRFFNTSLAQLRTGNRLVVIGQDTGSTATGFVAQDVFK